MAKAKTLAQKKTISDYANMPNVEVDGKVYVDKEIFVGYAVQLLEENMEDAQSEDERTGFEVSMQILCNM